MARRGFFAELQHQAKQAEQERIRQDREIERKYQAAQREAEKAIKAEIRLQNQLEKANDAERKRIEKEALIAHQESMVLQVEEKNLQLAEIYDEIDTLLEATLGVDDYVDLNTLKVSVEHPPFSSRFAQPELPPTQDAVDPPPPVYNEPNGFKLLKALTSKAKREQKIKLAQAKYETQMVLWNETVAKNAQLNKSKLAEYDRRETERVEALEREKEVYINECSIRESEVEKQNAQVDQLITDLSYGSVDAIHEYVSIVLSNSVYPPHFPVGYSFQFDSPSAELSLRVLVPGPGDLPDIKAYKYTKSTDEITSTKLSQKACKDRYSNSVHQTAIRSLHEIFEADRRGLIKTISLEVGTETIHPATGKLDYIPFVATGAERESFIEFDLSCVIPSATLEHLGASVSKNPFGLIAADASGVRKS